MNIRNHLPQGIAGAQLRQQQVAVAIDHGQQVIEVVRHAAGQAADRLQLLRLKQFFFELRFFRFDPLAVANVPGHGRGVKRGALVVADHKRGDFHIDQFARVEASKTRLATPVAAFPKRGAHFLVQLFFMGVRHKIDNILLRQFRGG